VQPDAFPTKQPPALVAWLNSAVKATHKRRLERNELLTPDEIALLIHKSPAARDRALLSVLWETGGRIAEIGNRTIQQVNKHQFGYTLDITGKTGQRSPLVISSAPYLTAWLATHPFPAPHHPLWVRTGNVTTPCALGYAGFMSIVHRALKRAGLTKRVYPHLFRHSRATYCVANGLMNEQQAKAYFGWAPSSRMLAIYAHLTIQDANNAILRENNLAPTQGTTDILQPQHCPACQRPNPHNTAYCTQCNTVLNEQRVRDRLAQQEASNAVILQLCKVLVDKGLLDEAADQLHAANLGAALQALMK
jgi:integrase/predicted nucleic acid-binding Zn ribbon protein